MSKLSIIHIASLVFLGVLLVFTVFRLIATGGKYSEISRGQLLQTDEEYIIQFDIMNREGEDKKYTIKVAIDDYRYSEDVLIPDGRIFSYIHEDIDPLIINICSGFLLKYWSQDVLSFPRNVGS